MRDDLWTELIARIEPDIRAAVGRLLHSGNGIDDCVQETWLRLIELYGDEPSRISLPLAVTVARGKAIDLLRKHKNGKARMRDGPRGSSGHPEGTDPRIVRVF